MNRTILLTVLICAWCVGTGVVQSQTYNVLYNFDLGSDLTPYRPDSLILSSDGNYLYGMGCDLPLFSEPVTGGSATILYSFIQGASYGLCPYGAPVQSRNTLYGVTCNGGDTSFYGGGGGIIFSEPVTGGTPAVLYTFNMSSGYQPFGSLVLSGSTLYGMTSTGGSNTYCGTIFSEPITGGPPSVLYNFDWNGGNGFAPNGSLILSGSTLYGMACYGGSYGNGVIFSEPITGGTPTRLGNFNGTNGTNPLASLVLSGGTLYGTTPEGGSGYTGPNTGYGTIFSESVNGGDPKVLFNFDGTHGEYPYGSLIVSGHMLYGMTRYGGQFEAGTIFSYDLSTDTLTLLHSFNVDDGLGPEGDLVLSNKTLYGVAGWGGDFDNGVIFSMAIPEPATLSLLALGGLALLRRRKLTVRAEMGIQEAV
jgi:uncharacterized repeat protein (TIGR03803 family)